MTLPKISRCTGWAATASADCRTSTSAATKAASLLMPILLLSCRMDCPELGQDLPRPTPAANLALLRQDARLPHRYDIHRLFAGVATGRPEHADDGSNVGIVAAVADGDVVVRC